MAKIGIIGGSGLDNPEILKEAYEEDVETEYGLPSSPLTIGKIGNVDVVLLARHGKKHTIPPSEVNNRANIMALKNEGCTHILATTACGSLKEEIERGDFVILDQFIDFTKHRASTFYDSFSEGIKHQAMAEPFDRKLREVLIKTGRELSLRVHEKGTVITIEGPRFSTLAESLLFKSWGVDVINMSIAPEAALANEAGIPYAVVAMSTDYDCWRQTEKAVSWEDVLRVFHENSEKVKQLLVKAVSVIGDETAELIRSKIRTIPNWPKQGVMFRDITTLLKDADGLKICVDDFYKRYKDYGIDKIVGIDSRGFIIGGMLAYMLGVGFIPARKKGKLPAETEKEEYALEYGRDSVEMHKDAIKTGEKVLIVDDLIATGGTVCAVANLVKKLGGVVVECAFIIELPDLKGGEKLKQAGISYYSQTKFEGK